MFTVRQLDAHEARLHLPELAGVLVDCVEGGASVHFLGSLSRSEAEEFFSRIADQVAEGKRLLIAAFADGRIAGTVQVILETPPNGLHRGEVSKMLVHRDFRRQGLGEKLLLAAENGAREAGKTLLFLDTEEGKPAERLYEKCGWVRVGVIPDFALTPAGDLCATVIFYKKISP